MESAFVSRKKKKYFLNIINYLHRERSRKIIYPPKKYVFNAFLLTEFSKIKVVIIGQDPYFSKNQAHGLAFSVPKNCSIPPSLKNIYKEINKNFKRNNIFNHGCLKNWAKQGVFLLNSILTVESGKPKSHYHIGWNIFTDKVISLISYYRSSIVFLLWGNDAKKKCHLINMNNHYVFTASHPSPLSAHRGFFGCNHFSKTNSILLENKKKIINWFKI
ncbi:uracil-DNA glycosylase [Buchnera aphidicola (Melanaphis sacchari)]|uniref:Uracil-DNA glycosylase n=1 Tax=Buchnera aphidicola (Melanaphis sacchari) TaxID=2173854 RepID=A0A2U8DFL2_9GAMM|nr:uracil-DNA glycosylase [Buchnera aphidicola (Melanaphis sacchari)]